MAHDAAVGLNHSWLGPEHLLLGILRTEGPARDALRSVDIDFDGAQAALERIAPRGSGAAVIPREIGLTPQATEVIERAEAIREERKTPDLTPSILLLSLISDDGNVVSTMLANLGATPDAIREALTRPS
jgi:ATP-dependent Clp protease ATP-binding subunit ClpC